MSDDRNDVVVHSYFGCAYGETINHRTHRVPKEDAWPEAERDADDIGFIGAKAFSHGHVHSHGDEGPGNAFIFVSGFDEEKVKARYLKVVQATRTWLKEAWPDGNV